MLPAEPVASTSSRNAAASHAVALVEERDRRGQVVGRHDHGQGGWCGTWRGQPDVEHLRLRFTPDRAGRASPA